MILGAKLQRKPQTAVTQFSGDFTKIAVEREQKRTCSRFAEREQFRRSQIYGIRQKTD